MRIVDVVGKEFEVARGYGHARYRIVADWHEKDAIRYESGVILDDGEMFTPAVVKIGGYSGPPRLPLVVPQGARRYVAGQFLCDDDPNPERA